MAKVTFISALEQAMNAGKSGDELVAAVKLAMPSYDDKKIKSKLKSAIKYIEAKSAKEQAVV